MDRIQITKKIFNDLYIYSEESDNIYMIIIIVWFLHGYDPNY